MNSGATINFVFPGTIDVELATGVRFQARGQSQLVELGVFRGGDDTPAEEWLDESRWQWKKGAADRQAQAWVKHVMVANRSRRPQAYEFDDKVILVGATLPRRQVESSLLQAGFRPSLATWRAKATDERRERLPEFLAWLGADGPKATTSISAADSKSPKKPEERAQHVWMRWSILVDNELAIAGRTYRMRGRPTLRNNELFLDFRHPSSGAELALSFDVGEHPLHHTVTAKFGDQTVVREALAWEEYPEFVSAVGDAIKPRSAPRKGAAVTPKSAAKPASTKATPRSSLPAEEREGAAEQIGELVLPPHRRSAYLARVEKAAARGESPKRIVSEAIKESKEFVQERAANRSRELTWAESVTHAFEQEPGWRLDIVKRGADHRLSIYPEGGALGDAVLAIDVRENAILDVHWLPGALTTAQQNELLRRIQRALKAANAAQTGSLSPSPLQGRIEEVRRRAAELGIDPAVPAGQASHGAMARALAYLADPRPEAPGDLIKWLRANHGDHPALSVIKEWRDGDAPGDSSLAGELWSAVFEESSTTTVRSRDGRLQTSIEAPFTTRDGGQAVLLRRARRQGEVQLYKMSASVRPTDDPNICEVEDDARDLRDGDQLLLVGDEDRADEQIELYRRIAEFIDEVERTPERLEDVRQLLFLTAAMIGAPRCKGAHRAAATRAFEKAREYYDTARRSLARGAAIAASERVHDALRRIGLAAASIAEACAEGQEPLATRVSSEHAPSIEPSEEDAETMRALEAAEKLAGSPNVTASVVHDRRARAITGCPPLAQVREILARANVAVDPAGVRVVGRFGECLADAATRDRARKALLDAGIHASIVRDRLLFPLRRP